MKKFLEVNKLAKKYPIKDEKDKSITIYQKHHVFQCKKVNSYV